MMIEVRATEEGYDGTKRRVVGEVFMTDEKNVHEGGWMEPTEPRKAPKNPPAPVPLADVPEVKPSDEPTTDPEPLKRKGGRPRKQ